MFSSVSPFLGIRVVRRNKEGLDCGTVVEGVNGGEEV